MGIKWKEHRGKQVLYIDFSDRKSEKDMLQLLDEQARVMKESQSNILVLSNVTGTTITSDFMSKSKEYGKEIFHARTKKSALIGITGMKSILMQGYQLFTGSKNTKSFQTESEALDWLIKDEG
jgi:hypothetical protein